VAESYTGSHSTVAGAVVRADSVVDGFTFDRWTVGGTDATDTAIALLHSLDRPDIQYLLLSGIAPAWFNVLDLHRVADATGLPTLSVSFEDSPGLTDAVRREFSGAGCRHRLATYYAQPDRRRVDLPEGACWVRAVDCDDPAGVVRALTPEGGRPEPLRVARLAARAADAAGLSEFAGAAGDAVHSATDADDGKAGDS
jgi:endonuclease V-like protein UPF0215 family